MDFNVSSPTGDKIVKIDLPENGRIGILISGGLDSAVMTALILMARQVECPSLQVVALNVKRGFGTESFSKAMVEKMEEHFSIHLPLIHLDIPEGIDDHHSVYAAAAKLMDKRVVKKVFTADTQNPPIDNPFAPNRNKIEDQNKFPRWGLPFIHLDKSHTVALMKQLNLNFIEEMSHTCFATDSLRCNACFQCEERAWAYQVLGLTDTGKF